MLILEGIPKLCKSWQEMPVTPYLDSKRPFSGGIFTVDETPETFRKIVAFITDRENYPFPYTLYKRLEYWEIPYIYEELSFTPSEEVYYSVDNIKDFYKAYPSHK